MPLNRAGTGLNKAAKTGGGASAFTDLTDTPGSLGTTGQVVRVDGAGTALEFATLSGTGDLLADGTVPLTANWDVGAFSITALTFTSDVVTGTAPFTVASTTVVTNLNADTVDGIEGAAFLQKDGSVALTANWDAGSFKITAQQLESDVITGTAPLVVASTTVVPNLNADQVDGLDSTAMVLVDGSQALTANWDVGAFTVTGTRFISDIATGTAPFGASSTTLVTNLNADLLDGQEGSYYRDASNLNAGTLADARVAESNVTQHRQAVFTLAEDTGPELDASLSADGKFTGTWIDGTAGATLAFGDICYLAVADTRWELADASAASTSGDVILGICILAAASDGSATKMLLHGTVKAATFPAFTVGAPLYVSETAGDITGTEPTTTDSVTRCVGFALDADNLYFNPSTDYYTHT